MKPHVVDVMLPPTSKDKHGETQGEPTLFIKEWPVTIKHLRGDEAERARALVGESALEVRGYIDPGRPITRKHYLQYGARKLDIANVEDIDERGREYRLICGEQS